MSIRYELTDRCDDDLARQFGVMDDEVFGVGDGADLAELITSDLRHRDGFRLALAYDGPRLVGMGVGYQESEDVYCWLHTMVLAEYRGYGVGGAIHDMMCDVPYPVYLITASTSAMTMLEARGGWTCLAERALPGGQAVRFMWREQPERRRSPGSSGSDERPARRPDAASGTGETARPDRP